MASTTVFISLPLDVAPFIRSLQYANPYTTNVVFCKMRTYLIQSTTMMYRWCLVAACFDRCVLTSTNARLRELAKVRIAYRVIIVIAIIWLILPVHTLVFFNVKGGKCFPLDSIIVSLYHSIYTIMTGSILPVSIMIICAVIIHRNLLLKRQRRHHFNTNLRSNNENLERKRDQQIFMMLLLQALAFVVTQSPWMVFNIYTTATIYVTNKSSDRASIERFINFMADVILFLLPVLSFYLYTLASRTFRDELWKLLRCPVRRRQMNSTNRVTPFTNNTAFKIELKAVQTLTTS
jgi:hypothetical protein